MEMTLSIKTVDLSDTPSPHETGSSTQ